MIAEYDVTCGSPPQRMGSASAARARVRPDPLPKKPVRSFTRCLSVDTSICDAAPLHREVSTGTRPPPPRDAYLECRPLASSAISFRVATVLVRDADGPSRGWRHPAFQPEGGTIEASLGSRRCTSRARAVDGDVTL